MRKVWDVKDCCYDEYDDEWFDNVNMEGAEEFELCLGKLKVIYKDGKEVYYHNVFGTWGNPVEFV